MCHGSPHEPLQARTLQGTLQGANGTSQEAIEEPMGPSGVPRGVPDPQNGAKMIPWAPQMVPFWHLTCKNAERYRKTRHIFHKTSKIIKYPRNSIKFAELSTKSTNTYQHI